MSIVALWATCWGTAQLICGFVFTYAKNRFSHDVAQMFLYLSREDTTQTEMLIEEVEDDNPSFVRRPRRLTRSRHVDIRNFLSSFGKLIFVSYLSSSGQ